MPTTKNSHQSGKKKEQDNRIYEFILYDAWGSRKHGICLLDDNTVQFKEGLFSELPEHDSMVIPEEVTHQIKAIINGADKLHSIIKPIRTENGLDGFYQSFIFNSKSYASIEASNIQFNDSEEAQIVLSVHECIANVLIKQNVPERYFFIDE